MTSIKKELKEHGLFPRKDWVSTSSLTHALLDQVIRIAQTEKEECGS